ncbi:hypothetical protein [Planctomicrobium piriforme]|uniref:Uncharacterized protein n=1 Tax=Planctomicrobium piriforme TaxID=1576369 RepID=A0A1I3EEJ0_9PLAN|nr:hypothetical protein [Planctomicrobium piriforme]SFH97380.1 hypothetical protein SAMN05421753_104189 [Planctomicrobium piriforme]
MPRPSILKRLYSWLQSRRIGEIRYVWASPKMSGPLEMLLPPALWEGVVDFDNKVRLHMYQEEWTGFDWATKGRVTVRFKDAADVISGKVQPELERF